MTTRVLREVIQLYLVYHKGLESAIGCFWLFFKIVLISSLKSSSILLCSSSEEDRKMKTWIIGYWSSGSTKSPIEKWLDKLTTDQFEAVFKELRTLKKAGNTLRLPHSRSLSKGLFELRERRYGYRLYYCFRDKQLIVLLAAGDKTTQDRDIKVAYERLSQIGAYYENKEL